MFGLSASFSLHFSHHPCHQSAPIRGSYASFQGPLDQSVSESTGRTSPNSIASTRCRLQVLHKVDSAFDSCRTILAPPTTMSAPTRPPPPGINFSRYICDSAISSYALRSSIYRSTACPSYKT
ncbi:hypothetical protein B0H10DRAFT_869120 [Mycena sp. CBHHK59/15]|nr:hypothetical protein B0H10DRAFT_869120 [Mycena sp. CBHHK59/15]